MPLIYLKWQQYFFDPSGLNIHILWIYILFKHLLYFSYAQSSCLKQGCNYEKLAFGFTKKPKQKLLTQEKGPLMEYYFFWSNRQYKCFSGISVRLFKNSSKHFHTKLGFEICPQTWRKCRSPCSFWAWLPKEAQKTWPPSMPVSLLQPLHFQNCWPVSFKDRKALKKAQK